MKLLFATAEFAPLARSGGLGDAVAGLVGALSEAGHDVTVALPAYRLLDGVGTSNGGTWRTTMQSGVDVRLFVDDEAFDRPGLYGPGPAEQYDDNWLRFGRFALAVAELAAGYDVLHLQDAHTGVATLVSPIPTVFTVHNAAHPVLGPLSETAELLGLDEAATAPEGPLEWYGNANFLKAGLVGADQATTVSPGHAAELGVDETSFGLAGVVRSLRRPMVGIVNGIDTNLWDPATDSGLAANYSSTEIKGRSVSRAALIELAGIDDGFIVANVGRMARQKGFDLLVPILDDLIAEGMRLVLVGNGELDDVVDGWASKAPHSVSHLPYTEETARMAFAGTDAYLMPSRFEPCGLGQLYAMRYGAPPIVRFTGGLRDTVVDVDEVPELGNGFGFRGLEPAELSKTIRRAMRIHRSHPALWERIRHVGMATDLSWSARATDYEKLYSTVVG